jgi:hypothetical protein
MKSEPPRASGARSARSLHLFCLAAAEQKTIREVDYDSA